MARLLDFNDIVGKKIGKLTVLKYVGKRPSRKYYFADWTNRRLFPTYKVNCECGENSFILRDKLIKKIPIKSCTNCCRVKHGFNKTRIYNSWRTLKRNRKKAHICERWNKFENFLEDMGERPDDKILMRKNTNKGYYRNNCRWGTIKEFNQNLWNCNLIRINGKKKSLLGWFKHFGFTVGQYNWYRVSKKKKSLREYFNLKDKDKIIEHYRYKG